MKDDLPQPLVPSTRMLIRVSECRWMSQCYTYLNGVGCFFLRMRRGLFTALTWLLA